MKREDALLWLLALLLALAIVVTILWTPRGSRHGYGSLLPAGTGRERLFSLNPSACRALQLCWGRACNGSDERILRGGEA